MANAFDPLLEIFDGNFTARWNFPLAVGTLITAPGGIGSAVSLTYSCLTSSASEPTFAPLTLIGVADLNWSLPGQANTWVKAAGGYVV